MFEQNNENTVKIKEGQFLKNVIKEIPSNRITFKRLPGSGATSGEIENEERDSIIIVANVPVIEGKCAFYNNKKVIKVLGIYERKTEEDIINYLQSDIQPKKIIVTPESFRRVKETIIDFDGYNLYKDFFLLFDECEKTIQDVNYRADIILPMVDFFKFKKKSFISATPIVPSDPRFVKENFKALYIEPDYDFKETLDLICTNNIMLSFKKFIETYSRDQYFIFFKSTTNIANIVETLDIKSECAIFCSKESRQTLKVNGFNYVHTQLKPFKKFNFFTSRFFSAVDIEYEKYQCDPTIIMITDLAFAQHSTIDPCSEAIQIPGRFRKPKNTEVKVRKEIIHITNCDPVLSSMSRTETVQYVSDRFAAYEFINNYLQAATSRGTVDALKEMLEKSDYKKYINPDGTRNYFMLDNIIFREQVNGYYHNTEKLNSAYFDSKHFNVKIKHEDYEFTDKERKKAGYQVPLKSVFEVVVPVLHEIHKPDYNIYLRASQMEMLTKEFPKVVSSYITLGYERIAELGFNYYRIKKAIADKKDEQSRFGLLDLIRLRFKQNEELSSLQIINRLKRIFRQLGIKHLKPNVQLLKKYCRLSDRFSLGRNRNGKETKGYRILEFYR